MDQLQIPQKHNGENHSQILHGSFQYSHRLAIIRKEERHIPPPVHPSEIRYTILSMKSRTPGSVRVRPEHLKNPAPLLINTLARFCTRYLSQFKVVFQWNTHKTVLLFKKGDHHDIGNYRPICFLSIVYKLFTPIILNRIDRTAD
ncbi:unnamed protein product [Angiostrongylus costaricensis]|uniref:Reverse transcriptase domain-containing protein n=1 Tax=Angiostrongylus costaricensis TaxID=334426 RepID=A0A0R3PYD9_ANGCS|nr:unnamed protein product [Angiostrongylus costaricensis]